MVLGAAPGYWVPAFVLTAIYLLLIGLPSDPGQRVLCSIHHLLLQPRNRVASLLLACGSGVGVSLSIAMSSLSPPPPFEFPNDQLESDKVQLVEVSDMCAFTDAGHSITLKTSMAPNAGRLDPANLRAQYEVLARNNLRDQVIHIPVGWQNSNCHGWVFTSGQYWVGGDQVDTILHDNQYRPVFTPRSGDLTVYRSEEGTVTHTGIVRYVSPDGATILVESKWGNLGRFIHPHDTHCYGIDACSFYRSERSGHRLHGLPSLSPTTPAEPMNSYIPAQTTLPEAS